MSPNETEISPYPIENDEAPVYVVPPGLVQDPLAAAFTPFVEDALAQPEDSRPYVRYVIASRGAAAFESEQEQMALLRLVNSVSLSPQLAAPVLVPELGAYRLDLRDYLWNRTVELRGVEFSDGWEVIVDGSGLALPPLPDERLAELTGTTTSVLPARAFLTAAASGSVYYALTSAPGFEIELQERLAARYPDPEAEQVYNPAFGRDARHSYQGARRLLLPDGRAYWQGLPNTPRGNSLLYDPFGFNSWETDAIYPLPNGFPAFFLDTPYYENDAPAPLTQLRGRVENTSDGVVADCIACHSSGPLPVDDFFPEFVRDNIASYNSESADFFMERWPSQQELDAIVEADAARYTRVLEEAGLSIDSAGALQVITRGYTDGLDLADMATALHASEMQVSAVLPESTTTLDADTFLARFRGLLCLIHPDSRIASDYCS